MKQILFILFTNCILFVSCTSLKKATSSSIQQGISGKISEIKGNQMPSPDAPRTSPKGIKATVFVYEPTNISQVVSGGNSSSYTSINTKMVASVQTDSLGAFILALPVGTYSIFVQQGKGYYANLFDTNNNIALFEVLADKLTTVNLTVSSKASF